MPGDSINEHCSNYYNSRSPSRAQQSGLDCILVTPGASPEKLRVNANTFETLLTFSAAEGEKCVVYGLNIDLHRVYGSTKEIVSTL